MPYDANLNYIRFEGATPIAPGEEGYMTPPQGAGALQPGQGYFNPSTGTFDAVPGAPIGQLPAGYQIGSMSDLNALLAKGAPSSATPGGWNAQTQQFLNPVSPQDQFSDMLNRLGYSPINPNAPSQQPRLTQSQMAGRVNPGGKMVQAADGNYYWQTNPGSYTDAGFGGKWSLADFAPALAIATGGLAASGGFLGAGEGIAAGSEGYAGGTIAGDAAFPAAEFGGGAVDTVGTMGVDLGNIIGDLSGAGSGEFVTPQMLTQAVQDGTLTQAQASQILQSISSGGQNGSSLIQSLTNQGLSPQRALSLVQNLSSQGGGQQQGSGQMFPAGTNTNVGGQGGFGDILSSALGLGGQVAPGLLALNYARNQPPVDTSQLQNVFNQAGANMPAFQQAAIDPLRQTQAAGYGDILQSQAKRGIRGSSFGDSDIANYLTSTNRGIANAGANATQQSLGLQGNLAGQITNYNMLGQQQKNDLYGRALGSFGQGINPTTAGGAVGGGIGSAANSLFNSLGLGNIFGGGIASGPGGYAGGTIAGDANLPGQLFGQGLSVTPFTQNNILPTDYSNLIDMGFL